jgi:polysaccharide export outer membrane protein
MDAKRVLMLVVMFGQVMMTGCCRNLDEINTPEVINAFRSAPPGVDVTESYVLDSPDEITVYSSKVPELNEQVQVIRPDGHISLESVGEIMVAGKTPREVAEIINDRVSLLYKGIGENPVDVRVSSFQSKVFFIVGQVRGPGAKIVTGKESTLSAIAKAVPLVTAWQQRIQIIRPYDHEKGLAHVFELNFQDMSRRGDMRGNFIMQEGDVIYVPPTILAAIGMTISELVSPIYAGFGAMRMMDPTP